jgi:hypothetical protein
MSYIGATGLTEYEERFDTIEEEIDVNANYINNLVGIPDPIHLAIYGINVFNPSMYGLVERAEVNISQLQTNVGGLETTVSGLETTISGIETSITAIETEVAGIQTEIGGIQTEVVGIQGEITGIEGSMAALSLLIGLADGIAVDARNKADKSLGIWDESGINVYHKKTGNVGIGNTFGSVLNNKLEVNGNINIPTGSTFRINNLPLNYSHLAGTLPIAGIGTLGGVKIGSGLSIDGITGVLTANAGSVATQSSTGVVQVGSGLSITPQGVLSANATSIATTTTTGVVQIGTGLSITAQGLLSLSDSDIFLNGTANRAYGWSGSTSLLGRVAVADGYSTGSIINDVVLRSAGNLILQSGITNPSLVINATNQALFRDAVGIGTATISTGNILDVAGILKIASGSGTERLTITSTGVQVNHTLNISSGVNTGGLLRFGGFADDSSGDLAIIQNREYATNKGELLLFRGDNIEGTTGVDRIRLRAGAIAFDTYSATSTSATTESIRMYITGAGRVGIGITNPPNALLHLHKTATSQEVSLQFTDGSSTSGSTRGLVIGKSPDNRSFIINFENTALYFATNGIERMNISNTGALSFTNSVWHQCLTGNRRMYFAPNATTYIEGYSGTPIVFRNGNDSDLGNIDSSGNLAVNGFLYAGSYIYTNGFIQGNGAGGAYRILRYDNWVRLMNTAQNLHLDFAAGRLYAHYELDVQGGSTFNAGVTFNGVVYCYNGFIIYNNLLLRLTNISSTNTDYVCVSGNTSFQSVNDKILYIANGTFTGFHRNYTDDELFDAENPEIFKNSFIGCIVISSGKIKTDYSAIEEEISEEDEKLNSSVEWKSAIGKEGIFIEDALPIVKLSRVKKDKRVFGVVGDPTRSNNSKERLIINSVGEGAICVCNTNGNIENGDYIQSSDVLGHGEKQDDDILHNYTVAKATIDCNFELNSPYYECIERPDGIRTAFIACTYHCG